MILLEQKKASTFVRGLQTQTSAVLVPMPIVVPASGGRCRKSHLITCSPSSSSFLTIVFLRQTLLRHLKLADYCTKSVLSFFFIHFLFYFELPPPIHVTKNFAHAFVAIIIKKTWYSKFINLRIDIFRSLFMYNHLQ